VRTWIHDHSTEGRVTRRVESVFGESDGDRVLPAHTARLESPGQLATVGSRLGARFGVRLDPGRRGAAAVGTAALVAVLVAGIWVLINRPHASAVPVSSVSASASASPAASGSAAPTISRSPAAVVVVDVVGKVAAPGIYRLPAGSRVADAVAAAGGALAGVDLTTLNLAQVVSDGQQIAVAVAGAPAVAADGAGSGATSGPVNLNTATAAQLDTLPGVGPVLAQHILDWRTQHGRFTSVDQLREVSGIGDAKYQDLRSLVTV
jgi:competence protein ComEA